MRARAEASAAAGGKGYHKGAGAEGNSHSASAGAGPLSERKIPYCDCSWGVKAMGPSAFCVADPELVERLSVSRPRIQGKLSRPRNKRSPWSSHRRIM